MRPTLGRIHQALTMNWIRVHQHLLTQLMLLMMLALLGALGLQATLGFSAQSAAAREGVERPVLALSQTLAIASANPLVTRQIDDLDDLLQASMSNPDLIALRISDTDGRVLSHFKREAKGPIKRIFDKLEERIPLPNASAAVVEERAVDQDAHLVIWHPIVSGQLVGWVRADVSLDVIEQLRASIWQNTIKAVGLAVVMGMLLVYLFLRRPLNALDTARNFAVNLDRSQGAHLPPSRAPIEIRDLEHALNAASSKLHEQRERLDLIIEQLRQQESILLTRNQQLDAVFNLSPDGFVTFDQARCLDYANPAFFYMMGWPAEGLSGMPIAAFHARLKQACLEPETLPDFGDMVSADPAHADQAKHAYLITLRGPKPKILELKLRRPAEGTVSKILYLCDVTADVEVDRMKSEFVSHAAHELRTPMTSIFGYSELLMDMELDAETQRELLGTIHRQTAALIKIINELLDLARIDARGSLDFHLQPLDLVHLTKHIVADLGFDAQRWPVHIQELTAPLMALADPDKMRQALINVLSNAQKYAPQGGAIEVNFVQRAGLVGVRVADHGMGMSAEQLEQLGKRFWRADKSGNVPGTGLGVSILKEILHLHGGELEVSSTVDQGSVFTMWLPQAHPATAPAPDLA
jgi:two-component system sensor histidine kinase VicK